MTSTNFISGNFAEKPSSRVLRPPGGGSSDIFGTAEPSNNASKSAHESANQRDILNQGPKVEDRSTSDKHASGPSAPAVDTNAVRVKQRGNFNPITGQAYIAETDAERKAKNNTVQPSSSYSTRPW